ncbi:hypothetical protein [Novosphingopyxis sp.]|uniref:hypothetical protein n=1 Tax=Novosphingopyxis sp. TaxID=2709690 RepID=UPI003B5A66EA
MRPKSSKPKTIAEKVVKDIRRATRRHFSSEDKIRIVLAGRSYIADQLADYIKANAIGHVRGAPFHTPLIYAASCAKCSDDGQRSFVWPQAANKSRQIGLKPLRLELNFQQTIKPRMLIIGRGQYRYFFWYMA